MIQPYLAEDVKEAEVADKKQKKKSKEEKDVELQSLTDQKESRFQRTPILSFKFLQSLRAPTTSIARRAFTRNKINSEMLRVYKACETGDLATLQNIIDDNYEKCETYTTEMINSADENLLTPLHYASINNQVEVITYLLSKGAEIDAVGGKLNRTPLMMAIHLNHYQAVCTLLDHEPDVCVKDNHFQQILHIVAQQGNVETAKLLLQYLKELAIQASFLDDVDNENMTALHYASDKCHYNICTLLIEHGCQLSLAALDGSTALHLAAYRQDVRLVHLFLSKANKRGKSSLINCQDKDGKTILQIAVEMNNYEIAKLCLSYNADPNFRNSDDFQTSDLNTVRSVLHVAAINGQIDLVELLLQHKMPIDTVDSTGRTAMHGAVIGKNVEMIDFLHAKGLYLDSICQHGLTPLLTAVKKGFADITNKLLELGANIKVLDKNQQTCLHYAIQHEDSSILQLLLKNGAKQLINCHDDEGNTPLLTSVHSKNSRAIEILLNNGANLAIVNNNGDGYLHIAAARNFHNLIKTYCNIGSINVNVKNKIAKTPLHITAGLGHLKTLQTLLDLGADVNNCDILGNTPLHEAAKANQTEIVKILLKQGSYVNTTNRKRETPIHLACAENAIQVVQILLAANADISIKNLRSQTCFNTAVENNCKEVAFLLIEDKRWQTVMDCRGEDGYTPMKQLIEKMPVVAEAVLDRCVILSNHPRNHPDSFVTFNYKYIESPPQETQLREVKDCYLSISSMVEYNREKLFTHPLIMAYQRHKWNSGLGLRFYMELVSYFIIVSLFSIVMGLDLICNTNNNATYVNNSYLDCRTVPQSVISSSPVVIVVLGSLVFIGHLIAFLARPYERIKNFSINFMEMFIGLFSVVFGILAMVYGSNVINSQLGAVLVFLALMVIVVSLQRADFLGQYIVMFIAVLKTVLKVMILVMIILIIFGISFQLAFNATNIAPFNEIVTDFLGLFVMFTGEISFYEIFAPKLRGLPAAHLLALSFLLIAFVVLLNVTLVNLLIGLAVGDIHELQMRANCSRIINQLVMIYEKNKDEIDYFRKSLYKPMSVYQVRGPKGKLRNFIWRNISGRALIIKRVFDRIKEKESSKEMSYDCSGDHDYDMHDAYYEHKQLKESITELKKMVQSIAAKVNAEN
ncbi:Transient receptor potential cation channel subfamily A member 1 [Trichoplax sp. H2]|nr:Transient receptor potential cation channel subfamily A member 1 [Trichoplax sp. H2]|eukprot:RDD41571.1 Transient receptor potential cation channel subfamily A member 1 [Trichoplax sp. H2]